MVNKDQKSLTELIKTLRLNLKLDNVNWEDPENIYGKMSENDKRTFHANIHSIKTNPAYKKLIDFLINKQVIYTVLQAETFEQMMFGRASINGLMLIDEYVDQFNAVYEDENKKEDFNKMDVI